GTAAAATRSREISTWEEVPPLHRSLDQLSSARRRRRPRSRSILIRIPTTGAPDITGDHAGAMAGGTRRASVPPRSHIVRFLTGSELVACGMPRSLIVHRQYRARIAHGA